MTNLGRLSAGLVAMACALSACGGPVEVAPPSPSDETADVCRDLFRVLPGRLDGEAQRETKPRSPFTAAFGDPAVVVRCGVPRPGALSPTSQLFAVDGVDWLYVKRDDGAFAFTTTGRVAYVEVTVPREQQPGSTFLVDLAGPVSHSVPEKDRTGSPVTAG